MPYSYVLGATEVLSPRVVFAHFDGTSASGQFLPCVSYYSATGVLLARAFPSSALSAGATADVSWFRGGDVGVGASSLGQWQYATPVAPASANAAWAAGQPFVNGWLNTQLADGTYNPLRYRTTPTGVQIVGAIAGGAIGTTVLTLPAAYVPPYDIVQPVGSIFGVGTFTMSVTASTGALALIGTGGPAVIVARGTFTGNVSTTGTTFATGTDIFSTPLTFIADGVSAYRVVLQATAVSSSGGANSSLFHLNLDGADGGLCTGVSTFTAGADVPGYVYAYMNQPAPGAHTVNIRIVVTSNTGTIQASAGNPGLMTIERLP